MTPFLASLSDAFSGSATRRAILDEALRQGLPSTRHEAWKYTSVRALAQRRFTPRHLRPDIDPAALPALPSPRIVFVNGHYAPALTELSSLPDGIELTPLSRQLAEQEDTDIRILHRRYNGPEEVFAQLNNALANDGILLRVEAQVSLPTTLHLIFIALETDQPLACHSRHLLDIRHGAELTLVEHHLSIGQPRHWDNTVTHVHLKQSARLQHVRIQHHAQEMASILRTDAVLARDASYQRIDLELGGQWSRHELNTRLEGVGSKLRAHGILLAHGRRHLDTRLNIDHIASGTYSDLSWRSVAADRARVVFHGGISIRPGADDSDARLHNKNLLLSDQAEIDTQPVLIIDADEVKATHGATVGQLDAQALFYLRSRGLPEIQARRLLTTAFCREPLLMASAELLDSLIASLDLALDTAGMV